MKKSIILITISIMILTFSACTTSAVQDEATQRNETASPTIAPTAEPTSKTTTEPQPTPEPALSPELTADPQALTDAELNQQIQDFLNKEGEYTDEKVQENVFKGAVVDVRLGLVLPDIDPIQGIILGYIDEKETGNLSLLVGFDGKNNDRFVTLLEIPCRLYELSEGNSSLNFFEYSEKEFASKYEVPLISGDKEEIKKKIDDIKYTPVMFNLWTGVYEFSDSEREDILKNYGEEVWNLLARRNNGNPSAVKLALDEVYDAGMTINEDYSSIGGFVNKIENVEQINEIDSDFPITILDIRYFSEE